MSLSVSFDLRGATFSPCGTYRYELTRSWPVGRGHVLWIMLNPSTADAEHDDPTIRRCVDFSKTWGYAGLIVVNLFALRATDPSMLSRHPAPVGPENDKAILVAAGRALMIVAAWGNHGARTGRGEFVRRMLAGDDIPGYALYHLGLSKGGHPKHPLYLNSNVLPIRWGA